MLFINTRPENRAAALNQALLGAGYAIEALPLLELVAEPFNAELQQLYQQLPVVQVIVVVSPTAVEIGMQYLQQAGVTMQQLAHVQWVAVGRATAQALAQYQVDSHIPAVENSEGMLELPILQQYADAKIAFWRGLGGRQFMMQRLQQQGASILNFVLYHRQCPASSVLKFPGMLQQLQPEQTVAVLISSEASWLHWQQLCQYSQQRIDWVYVVLGERLVQLLKNSQSHAARPPILLHSLAATEIITTMRHWQGLR